jgi:predicted metal-dependent hydrolase
MAAARPRFAVRTESSVEQRRVDLDHPHLDAVSVRIRRSRRSRHVRIHVDEQGAVTASVPARFAAERLDPIVRERAEWLHDVLVRMELKARDTQVDLDRGDPVRWLGRWVPTHLERAGRRPVVQLEDDHLALRVPVDADPHDALVAWYRKSARAVFEQRVDEWAACFGLRAGKVSIREQRTRWGSCTHEGDLSFNWRLVLAPEWVLDSIVVHELCHIDELNHSDRFWALLDERYPRHQEASDWLRDHGPALRVTRPSAPKFTTDAPVSVAEGVIAPRRAASRSRERQGQISLFGP